jgi:outer membrane protein assembly factor BamE
MSFVSGNSVRILAMVAVAGMLAGCLGERDPELSGFHFPYKVGVHQGTVISKSKVANLRLGMNKEQVQQVMGSPPVVDMLHPDIWTYVDLEHTGNKYKRRKAVTLYFQHDQLIKIN